MTRRIDVRGNEQGGPVEDHESEQLELLPAKAPATRRTTVPLGELDGFEHATPRRELIESIARLGLLQPVVVAERGEARYDVIEGRRRAKAIQELAENGRWASPPRIDALVLSDAPPYTDPVSAGLALTLHAVRTSSPASELRAIEAILKAGGEEAATIKRIAEQTGMPVQTVRRRLKLRDLAPGLRAAFQNGKISMTVAEAAARLSNEQQQELERRANAGERISSRTVKDACRKRTREVAAELAAELFADRPTPWPATVCGHLKAALEAIPAGEREGELGQAVTDVIARAESGTKTLG